MTAFPRLINAKETIIQSEINTIVNGYTLDEFDANGYQNVKDDILKSMQDMFGGSDSVSYTHLRSRTEMEARFPE